MGTKKINVLEVVCPACGQVHKVPEDRFRTDLSRAAMQCAACSRQFSFAEQGGRPKAPRRSVPNLKVLIAILAVVAALSAVVFLSLAARLSGETSAFAELPEQVQVVLFGEDTEGAKGPEGSGLVLSVAQGYKLVRRDKSAILVVKGKIRNTGDATRTRILLEGRIVGSDGALRFITRSPCGKLFADRRLKRTKRGRFEKLFTRKGEFLDCSLKPGQEKPFQMIFADIPKDYDEEYTVQVKTLFSGVEGAATE